MEDGTSRKEFHLNSNALGLRIEPLVWHEMDNFSADCVLLVLASDFYDESDYIRNRAEFESLVASRQSKSFVSE
jgi:hypothetical protein